MNGVLDPRSARFKIDNLVRAGMEAGTLALVIVTPWLFGAVEPIFEFLVNAVLAGLLVLWGLRMLLQGRLSWIKCPVTLCLAGLFLVGMGQLIAWPRDRLALISPATAQLYEEMLPAQPEVLAGESRDPAPWPPGSTISVYPNATRQELLRLLAIFLLFALVRNNLASVASLRRLSLVALVNGTLLALFALVQHFSSADDTVFWTYQTPGRVFGPFVCRNHFPFYLNMCIGLGLGFWLSLWYSVPEPGGHGGGHEGVWRPAGLARAVREAAQRLASARVLQDPRILGGALALALMLSSVLASTSRGGILALAAGAIVVSCLSRFGVAPNTRRRAAPWWGAALVTATAAMGLMAWFGFDRVTARLQTIPGGTALKERAPLWFDTLALGKDFPLWGTGYGTFPYVEPLVRSRWVESGLVYGHAHNEYLEALVEGGIVRLGLTLVALALVFWFGCRALRRYQGQPVGALALGALFAVSTVAIHSVADFGIHIPAIALLATVISAQLCALGTVSADSHADSDAVRRSSPWTGEYAVRLGGIAPVAGAATAVVLGLVLYNEGGSDNRVQSLIAAWRLQRTGSAGSEERCLRDLEEMVPLAPGNALLQVELGQVHLDVFEQEVQKKQLTQALDAAQAVLAWAPQGSAAGSVHPALSAGPTWQLASAGQEMYLQGVEEQLVQKHLLPGLRHFLQARDLCPLLPEPHVWIAANVDRLQDAEPRGVYLQRSKRLLPTDAKIWFICGVQEIAGGQLDAAWSSWRRSLELSDRFLVPILDTASPLIGPAAILERVVPDQPALLQQAAFHLYPKPEAAAQRRPFLERAVTLLDAAGPLNADQCYLKATLQVALGHGAEALVAYREALALAPGQKEWRYEWAALLYQEGQLQEARKHLLTVLRQQPSHPEARKLYDRVVLELAKKS